MTQCERLRLLAGASGSTGQTGASGQTGLTGGIRFWTIDKCADMVGHQRAVEGRHVTQSERLRAACRGERLHRPDRGFWADGSHRWVVTLAFH